MNSRKQSVFLFLVFHFIVVSSFSHDTDFQKSPLMDALSLSSHNWSMDSQNTTDAVSSSSHATSESHYSKLLGLGFLFLGYIFVKTKRGKILFVKECATDTELDLNLNPITFWEPKLASEHQLNNNEIQVHKLLNGLPFIRSLVAIGSSAAKFVSLPVKNYKKDRSVVKGMHRGTIGFLRSVSLEAIGLGAHLAAGVHAIPVQAKDIISTTPPTSVPRPIQTRSSQPKGACQGIQQVIVNDEDSHSHEISYDVSSDDDISKKFVPVLEPTRPLWEDVFPYESYELKDSLPSWVYRMDSLPSWARMDLPLELELEIAKLFPKARWIDEARLPWRPTSFVPVFEQKQCQGRRDISVKALLAARAAKRREDEKENERKKKKETFRIEIARRKKEKMEIKEKKRQLEEKQKTEADVAFRNVLHEKCIKVDALEAARNAKRREEEKENERKKKKEAFKIKIATLKKEKLEQSKKQKENEIKIKEHDVLERKKKQREEEERKKMDKKRNEKSRGGTR